MKEKKLYLDVLRILAILMVFHLHFTVALDHPYGVFFGFANGNWGNVGTSLFFLISGNCLARNYGEKLNIGQFYKKRWLAIYPMFYVCYLLVLFGHTVILRNHIWEGVEPWRVIFTVLGIDKYLEFMDIRSGALVGEWYTAVIVGVYLLFPLLQFLYRKSKMAGTAIVLILYVLNIIFNRGSVPNDAHLITGICMFWFGMLSFCFEKKLEKMPWYTLSGVFAVSLILLLLPLPGPDLIYKNLLAVGIFLLFMGTGHFFKKDNAVLRFLCKIEYAVYLCHHTVILVLLSFYNKIFGGVEKISYYLVCLVITIVFATMITYLTKWIVSLIARIGKRNKGISEQ